MKLDGLMMLDSILKVCRGNGGMWIQLHFSLACCRVSAAVKIWVQFGSNKISQ
jgi:hypothetical protein